MGSGQCGFSYGQFRICDSVVFEGQIDPVGSILASKPLTCPPFSFDVTVFVKGPVDVYLGQSGFNSLDTHIFGVQYQEHEWIMEAEPQD